MLPTVLNLYDLKLSVVLGVPDWERVAPQIVSLDLQIWFHIPPKGCHTDLIQDTLCYKALSEKIESLVTHRSFHLIESLAYTLYHGIKVELPSRAELALKLKKNPPLPALTLSEFCIGAWK